MLFQLFCHLFSVSSLLSTSTHLFSDWFVCDGRLGNDKELNTIGGCGKDDTANDDLFLVHPYSGSVSLGWVTWVFEGLECLQHPCIEFPHGSEGRGTYDPADGYEYCHASYNRVSNHGDIKYLVTSKIPMDPLF